MHTSGAGQMFIALLISAGLWFWSIQLLEKPSNHYCKTSVPMLSENTNQNSLVLSIPHMHLYLLNLICALV